MGKKNRKPRLFDDLLGVFDDLLDHDVEPTPEVVIPDQRERDVALVMFWRKEKCSRCHTRYEGSYYHEEPLLQRIIEKPIKYFGKLYGWKFHAVEYIPVPDLSCYDGLPRKLETVHRTIRVCPRCVHKQRVIHLPHPCSMNWSVCEARAASDDNTCEHWPKQEVSDEEEA